MNEIVQIIKNSISLKQEILSDGDFLQKINDVKKLLVKVVNAKGKILLCGNGGSAADAQHIAAELSGKFYFDRDPLNAEALHCNTSYVTAVANDYGYEHIYSRMVKASAKKCDVLIGFSTSGNSENIVNAFKEARSMGVYTIAFTGKSGGKLSQFADVLLNVPSSDTPRIQEIHILVGHIVCELLEKEIFTNG